MVQNKLNTINITQGGENSAGENSSTENGKSSSKNYGLVGGFLKGFANTAAAIAGTKTAMENISGRIAYGDNYKAPTDKTNENLGTEIVKPLNFWDEMRKIRDEEWARADAIREQTRYDQQHAYQYAIEDLRRSGVNINLLGNINPAASGGGITNETGSMDYTMTEAEYNKAYEMLMQEIELNYKGDQAEKDRIMNMIKALITGGAILGGAAIKSAN